MNDFFKIADKYLKPVTTGAGVVLGLAVTYAAGSYLSGMSKLYGGFYTFMYVLFWIAFVLLVICGIYALLRSMQVLFHSRTLHSRHMHSHRLRPHHRVKSSALLAEVKFRLEISSALTAATR